MYDVIVIGARVAGAPTAMLLTRAGYRVLLVDRDWFPSDVMSTHYIHQPGVAALKRWGVFDAALAGGCPPINRARARMGPITIEGFGPAVEGVAAAYCPRRTTLDAALVDAAAAAGAEVRTGFSVQEILFEDGRVAGIRGRNGNGGMVEERARVVVGADGMRSLLARAVNAPSYNERPALGCYYYTYWSGLPTTETEFTLDDGLMYVGFPTDDGLYCLVAGRKAAAFPAYRADIEGTYLETLDLIAPHLAAFVRAGRREARWMGTADLPNFFRKPYGPGWALVGDAGYHKDPITGYGITDAFRDAEWLAQALDEGLSGRQSLSEALSGYEQKRNEFAMPIYELICQLASLEPAPPELQAIAAAVAGNDEATTQFFGVLDGSVSVPAFFAPENVQRILAGSPAPALSA